MVEQQRNSDPTCATPSDCTEILYGPDGSKLALMNGQTLVKAFVPLPGGATAVYGPSGLMYYRHADWLGSSRLASTPSRTLYYDGAYAPFGESYAETGTVDRSFTGQNSDTASGLADFLFREYSSAQQGRWISPDPAGMAAVSLTNPQSWNRYAYVGNNPLAVVDPLGLIGPCGPEIACPITTPAGCNWGAVNNSLELFCPDNFENDNFIIWQGIDGTDGGGAHATTGNGQTQQNPRLQRCLDDAKSTYDRAYGVLGLTLEMKLALNIGRGAAVGLVGGFFKGGSRGGAKGALVGAVVGAASGAVFTAVQDAYHFPNLQEQIDDDYMLRVGACQMAAIQPGAPQ